MTCSGTSLEKNKNNQCPEESGDDRTSHDPQSGRRKSTGSRRDDVKRSSEQLAISHDFVTHQPNPQKKYAHFPRPSHFGRAGFDCGFSGYTCNLVTAQQTSRSFSLRKQPKDGPDGRGDPHGRAQLNTICKPGGHGKPFARRAYHADAGGQVGSRSAVAQLRLAVVPGRHQGSLR